MFVSLTQFRRNPKLYFFNDKESSASPAAAKVPLPVLDCVSRTDGAIPHTNFILMLTENKDCNDNAVCVKITPAQNKLLQLLKGPEAKDFADSLRTVHFNGTYGVTVEEFCPSSSRYTHLLLDALQALAEENYFTFKKPVQS